MQIIVLIAIGATKELNRWQCYHLLLESSPLDESTDEFLTKSNNFPSTGAVAKFPAGSLITQNNWEIVCIPALFLPS